MARARNIKPAFFKNETLVELPVETRLLFIGLWTLADREGRLEDRPKRIKMEIYPADDFNVDSMLNQLCSGGFILRYEVDGARYIEIINFVKHQDPHYREKASEIPPPPGADNKIVANGVTRTQRARILERDGNKCMSCGSTEHLCIDHVVPVSKGGTSDDDNLQVLCLPCNTKKGNKLSSEFSTSSRSRVEVESKREHHVPLIPDSLIPDSLIPDSLQREKSKAESVLGDPPPDSLAPQVTDAGSACLQMRAAGIQGVNPSHPKLLALLAAGITPNEIGEVAREERAKGKGMAWVLAVAEGRRREAANVTAQPAAIPSGGARASPAEQRRQKQDAWLDELLPNHRRKPQPVKDLNDERTLDAEAPRRLG